MEITIVSYVVAFLILLCGAGLLLKAGYEWGWLKRNLQSNNYVHQQMIYYKELFERERLARKEAALRMVKMSSEILSLRESNEKKNEALQAWRKNPLRMHFTTDDIGKTLIEESHVLNKKANLSYEVIDLRKRLGRDK